MDYKKIWQFAYEAYKGDGGFSDGGYIDKYPRESDEKYKIRQSIAYYINLFMPNVTRYIGYIFKDKHIRDTKNQLLLKVLDDCDLRGNSMDVFISSFAKEAKVRGVGIVLVDMPKQTPDNLKEQLSQRALPYVVNIKPESITEYKLDNYGRFEYVKYSDTLDLSTPDETKIVDIIRYYDKQEWRVYQDDEVIESGVHQLGICPVVIFSESGNFPDIGEFTLISSIAKRHYNLISELDEILRGQTFSILTLQSSSPSDVELKLGTDNAIIYREGMSRPEFIAPPVAPSNTYQEEISKLESMIDKISYNFTTNQSQESGIALEIKFQGLNSSLSNFAMRLEDFELRIFEVMSRYLSISNDITVSYNKEFSINDINKEIQTLEAFKSLGYSSKTYESLKLQQIINNDLNSISLEDRDKIKAEIEDGMKG